MNIITPRFGKIEYTEADLITFPQGIPGVQKFKRYVLLPVKESDDVPFVFLQSTEDGDLCFLLLDTLSFFPDYEFELPESDRRSLALTEPEDVLVFTVVTVKGSLREATTNLKAPLVINQRHRIGKQIVLDKEDYLIKQPLFRAEPSSDAVTSR